MKLVNQKKGTTTDTIGRIRQDLEGRGVRIQERLGLRLAGITYDFARL